MNAAALMADSDLREQAIARLHEPVDKARAVFLGLVVVGHRKSIEAGEMIWALPGGGAAYGAALLRDDANFSVVEAPSDAWLREQQPVLRALTS